jgi:uncharacterized protein (DUF1697 family)
MDQTYIALLRGINVGGKRIVKMDALRSWLEALPSVKHVLTYIQSGNVIFRADTDKDAGQLHEMIESKLEASLGFRVPVVLRTVEELRNIMDSCPFAEASPEGQGHGQLHVIFLSQEPDEAGLKKLAAAPDKGDALRIRNREAYLLCRGSYRDTVYSNAFLEKKLGLTATTRNWETVSKLAGLAKSMEQAMS